jgi:protein-disulfide isomerase
VADRKRRGRAGGSAKSADPSRGVGKPFYIVLAVVVAAGLAFLLLVDRGGEGAAMDPLPAWVADVEADPDAGMALGPEDAPVTIMEFADYQCPHCAQFGAFTGRLIRQNYVYERGLVRWVLYDFPVGFPHSITSSLAARCADEQGAIGPMHDLLLARQSEWGPTESPLRHFTRYADELNLDRSAFRECMNERRPLEEIMASRRYGERLGVQGTPTLFLNGRQLDNRAEIGYETLERLIQAAADSVREAGAEESAGTARTPAGTKPVAG